MHTSMHEAFQSYPTFGMNPGLGLQTSLMNPAAALYNPLGIGAGSGIGQAGSLIGSSHAGSPYGGSPYGGSPYGIGAQQAQQLQAAAILVAQTGNPQLAAALYGQAALLANPFIAPGLQNGGIQNPLFGGINNPFQSAPYGNPWGGALGNPILGAGFQNPGLNPFHAVQQPFGGAPLGFSQPVQSLYGQSGYPLAPQSWIGQPGLLGAGIRPYQQGFAC